MFYVTDREPAGAGFGTRRLKETDTVSGLQSGSIDVVVRKDADLKREDWQLTGLPLDQVAPKYKSQLKRFSGYTAKELRNQFSASLIETIGKCTQKEIFVFIHGYNNSFEVASQNAAELSFHTGSPVVMYSWPSAAKLYRYSLDECNNEWSQEHYNEFLEYLIELKKTQNIKVNLVAHSMGNRLFVRGTPVMAGSGLFSDVYLVNPDFDAQTFIHYLSRYLPKDGIVNGVRGQLLISRRDKALSAAEGLFGGYTRLGQAADFTLSALTRPDIFHRVWKNPSVTDGSDGKETEERVSSIERALRVVDTTVFDQGLIGHRVPHEYIAWMHNRDKPPQGFELKSERSKGCNRISSFLARAYGHKIEKPIGKYLIVERTPAAIH